MKTKDRDKNPMSSERRELERRDPMERRPGAPRERSDEEAIGRPVPFDDEPAMLDDLDEPEPGERRTAR